MRSRLRPASPSSSGASRGRGSRFTCGGRPNSVPVILGSVLGMLMLMVFTAAASFVKLAR